MAQRKYLNPGEINELLSAVCKMPHPERNHCLILMGYLHGFRASELLGIKLSDIDLQAGNLNIRRLKNGLSTQHPLQRQEVQSIRRWLKLRDEWAEEGCEWLFISRKSRPLSRQQFWNIVKKAGQLSSLTVQTHPHMLRHSCGYALAGKGADTRLIQDYLGHRNIHHTVRYTAGSAERFRGIWHVKR
ncbi:tyrosine-type recombinase/integrase [Escherichia coli]|uniref:tyrosine-type DNA invertase n=1 Tax=Escherichia albertii TaxID=208962 RepID=UPI00176F45C2|nr:tyrosine-type DNA invertase [Escherichia albertii]EFI5218649.1 tyrosine-type recombinase/integrase [Escherichia coli]EGZ6922296.1 tyrosine-type recombinase/integrase [Escherichia coli]EKE3024581.1 tyrosine-type recombinase/integrase [Escherichia coli]WDB50807.1 tyrosine-type DNA invertase [Escherichia albertii]HAH7687534.1 tyrosine-type recombinase/integrase [Escherichia coli]